MEQLLSTLIASDSILESNLTARGWSHPNISQLMQDAFFGTSPTPPTETVPDFVVFVRRRKRKFL
jgi:hypothetical protein